MLTLHGGGFDWDQTCVNPPKRREFFQKQTNTQKCVPEVTQLKPGTIVHLDQEQWSWDVQINRATLPFRKTCVIWKPNQGSVLNRRTSVEIPEMASSVSKLERICQEDLDKRSKSRCKRLSKTYSRSCNCCHRGFCKVMTSFWSFINFWKICFHFDIIIIKFEPVRKWLISQKLKFTHGKM